MPALRVSLGLGKESFRSGQWLGSGGNAEMRHGYGYVKVCFTLASLGRPDYLEDHPRK